MRALSKLLSLVAVAALVVAFATGGSACSDDENLPQTTAGDGDGDGD